MKNKKNIPVYCITAASGTGKTSLLERLIPELSGRGVRVAVFKHAAHDDVNWDQTGKDSQRLTEAGAVVTGLFSVSGTMWIEKSPVSLEERIGQIKNVDLIFLEGFHDSPYPKIQLYREAVGKELRIPPGQCVAMVTDQPFAECPVCFDFTETEALADWILEQIAESQKKKEGVPGVVENPSGGRICLEEVWRQIRLPGQTGRFKRAENSERLPLTECFGRILAENVRAGCADPPFDRSAMDGYALRSEETIEASKERPVSLRIAGLLTAGTEEKLYCHPGEAIRIMTGAKLPEGADCVIRQEAVRLLTENRKIQMTQKVPAWDCVCREGENVRAGECIFQTGMRMDAASIGLAAGLGICDLPVRRRLRAAMLISGTELVRAGNERKPGQIYDALEFYLRGRMEQLGIEMIECQLCSDDPARLAESINELTKKADFLVTTGGVSVGVHDYLSEAIRRTGGEILFHGMAIKPGMPTMFSIVDGRPLLSLSGNPSAAAVAFELLMPQLWKAMEQPEKGEWKDPLESQLLPLQNAFEKSSKARRFLWGYSDGKSVIAAPQQRNGNLRTAIGQNCLIDIPAGSGPIEAGSIVRIFWLKNVSIS